MEIKYWVNFLKLIVTCYIAVCLKCYAWPWTHFYTGASPGFGRGGGQEFFFFRFGNLHVAKRHAAHGEAMRIARGVRGHVPPRKFFKTVQFGAF